MNKQLKNELETLLKQARLKLLNDHPFFGDLVFGTPVHWDDKLDPPTAATNGVWVKLHPDFFKGLTFPERMFLLAHEALHCVLLHCLRLNGRDTHKWRIAIDIVVNQLLIDNKLGDMPGQGVFEPMLYRSGRGQAEKIYELLTDEDCKKYSTGSGKEGFDIHLEAPEDEEETLKAKWRNKLQEAIKLARLQGKVSGDLEAFVELMDTPKVNWEEYIRETLISRKGQDRTWTKTNRRYASSGLSVPGKYGDEVGPIVIAVDCSGSTSDQMVGRVAAAIGTIQEDFRPEMVHVIYFDHEVKKHDQYGPDDSLDVKIYGRGGTAFSPIFRYIEDNNINPEICIVCTDLECNDYGPPPDYPVLWCVMESHLQNAPWGQVLVVD